MDGQEASRFDLTALIIAAGLAGCSGHGREREVIAQIEGSIRLPQGAELIFWMVRDWVQRHGSDET